MSVLRTVCSRSLMLGCALLCLLAPAWAQSPTPASPPDAKAERGSVNLNLIITDEANHSVTDVRREYVRVTEDGAPQTIVYFAAEERPVSYGIVVDTTGSMRSLLDAVIATGHAIVNENRSGDRTFVMHYVDADNIEIDQGWTSNRSALEAALDDVFIQGGLTATLDAMHKALDYATRPTSADDESPRRRALILISDGEDRGSQRSNPEALLSRLRETDVQVFVVGLTKLSREMRDRDKAMSLLSRLAKESGGRAFFPKSAGELTDTVRELTHDLHTQYVVGYNPTNEKRDGSFRKVQVTVASGKAKRTVSTRAGYTASH